MQNGLGHFCDSAFGIGAAPAKFFIKRIFAGGMPHHILWPNSVGGTRSDTESRHASVGFVVGLTCFDQTTQPCFLNPPRVFKSASGEPPEAARAMLVSSRSAPR